MLAMLLKETPISSQQLINAQVGHLGIVLMLNNGQLALKFFIFSSDHFFFFP